MFSFNIDKVNFQEELGVGAYGDVYAYNQKSSKDEHYVVKRISTSKIDIVLLSIQEIVLGFNCDHPHVLPIKGYHIRFDQENKSWNIYMKMPRMETSLKEKINKYAREGKSFTEEEVVKYFYSLILGLRYLHEKRIAHRDIKPDNILIDKDNNLKIADIGIGKLIEDDTTEILTQALGTRLYTAPEVIAHENKLKKKGLFVADIWSLGVLMAEVCVPKTRLINKDASGKDNEVNLTKILNGFEGKYNKVLLDLICGMLRADPHERKSLVEIQKALEDNFSKILGLSQDAREREGPLQKENEKFKLYIEQLQNQIKQLEEKIIQFGPDKSLVIPQSGITNEEEKKIEEVKPHIIQYQGDCIKVLKGHSERVYCLQTLPMDQLASGSADKTIKIWNSKTGDCIQTLTGHTGYVKCLQLLQTGELASASQDKTIKFWDLKTGSCNKTLTGHTDIVWCLQALSTGELASGSCDHTIKLWNIHTGEYINIFTGHTGDVYCLKLLSANELASASDDKTIKIWDLKTGICQKTLRGHNKSVVCLEMLRTGKLVSCSSDHTIRFWDPKSGNCLKTLQDGNTQWICFIKLLPTGELASGSYDKTIKIWDSETANCIMMFQGHTSDVNFLELLPTGELVSGSSDSTIKIWK